MLVVTVSGFKGGTGKTTLAALLGVAAALEGWRVAGFDLDNSTRNFASILNRRRANGLPGPDNVMVMEAGSGVRPGRASRVETLIRMARQDGYQLLVIDTGSGAHADLFDAHVFAHTVLTPMNDSPADLHGLFAPLNAPQAPVVNYREMMDAVRFERRRKGDLAQTWNICRNRVSALPTRIGAAVERSLEALAVEAGFDAVWSIRERVSHRAIALDGRTILDLDPRHRLTMSEVAGRSEARALLTMLGRPSRRIAA